MLSGKDICGGILLMICFLMLKHAEMKVPQQEVDALREIVAIMGATFWEFNADSCQVVLMQQSPSASMSSVECDCGIANDSFCHIKKIVLKGYSLPGVLPPGLVKLSYIKEIDFAYNLLSGTIPEEWASTQLNSISLLGNKLSGEIPKILGNITTLTYLNLELNQFSGAIPSELGRLKNLNTLILSSNKLTGKFPTSFSELTKLTDFRISDNNFNGSLPDIIQNWKELTRLEMIATGLEGPIPSNISLLYKLTDLRIADTEGPTQAFPDLRNAAGLVTLMLRNCNISGEIPRYVWNMWNLQILDVSFNKLVGEIPDNIDARSLKLVFLTGNMLGGGVPDSILKGGSSIDVSYNNFTWQGPEEAACQQRNLYINLFRSSSMTNTLQNFLPCKEDFTCPRYGCSLHVNSGGGDFTVEENNRDVTFEGDGGIDGGTARYYISDRYWGFSSTGDFMDVDNIQNANFVYAGTSTNLSELYNTARISPLTLTYFHSCLENGNYTVSLYFAEIYFTNDNTYRSLGRRLFDIYIQNKLVRKDFNIEDEARGAQRPVVRQFNATVEDNTLEIRFHWSGKGTTRIPIRGVYGPLVSAISVNPSFKTCSDGNKKNVNVTVYVIIGVLAVCIIFFIIVILWLKGCLCGRSTNRKDSGGLELQIVSFTLKQIKAATNNFDVSKKIGEGGFGPVYKGRLSDGTTVAVKQLSSHSRQGDREFLNEIGMISCLQHPNLVKLHGCCIEGNQLLLVYEYMEHNSLARALFGSKDSQMVLDWSRRFKICVGVARGLAFLHEEATLKIVHRDIKASNVLLDKDLNPKISDFGLAKLNEDDKTHISTRIAGTIGYMAPEYALWGYLTYKVDVYSFGILALEIVSGKNNSNYMPSEDFVCLLDWAFHSQQNGKLEDFLDERLGSQVIMDEVEMVVKIAILCTNASPAIRPTMSEVVSMLEGRTDIPDVSQAGSTTEDLRFRAMRGFREEKQMQSFTASLIQSSTMSQMAIASSSRSNDDLFKTNPLTKY